jgi:hypothetical protein
VCQCPICMVSMRSPHRNIRTSITTQQCGLVGWSGPVTLQDGIRGSGTPCQDRLSGAAGRGQEEGAYGRATGRTLVALEILCIYHCHRPACDIGVQLCKMFLLGETGPRVCRSSALFLNNPCKSMIVPKF